MMFGIVFIENATPHVDWVQVCRAVRILGFGAFMFAAGGWWRSIDVQEASLPYKDRSTAQLEVLKQKAGPDPAKTINCLTRKAKVAEHVAEKAKNDQFVGAPSADLNSIPDCPALPPAPPSAK